MESPERTKGRLPTLYITRNGMLEPLGQSQVLGYLRGLSKEYRITLISFEKPEDAADTAAMDRVRADCEAHGIRWLPQRFHHRPKGLAPAWSMAVFLWLCLREVRKGNAQLIHARSYIPAAVALVVNRMTGTPFIFDMRALWPEELITAGRLKRGSALHRAIAATERACLQRAAGVVSLTHAAVDYLRKVYPTQLARQRIVVIPTCADLDRFTLPATPKAGPRVYGCIGTVLSGWFRVDWLAAFFQAAAARDVHGRFDIITRDDPEQVRAAVDPEKTLGDRLTIGPRAPQDMPEAVRAHDVSVMFFTDGLSKLGSSPTRMAEVLGTGLPVVANAGVGDVAQIVGANGVGVLATGPSLEEMSTALAELDSLFADKELPVRCRSTAQTVFSLSSGTRAYAALYADILDMQSLEQGKA